MPYIPLHTHSNYSLLQGLSKIDDLVDRAKSYKMKSLALTDYHNLYSAVNFYKKATKEGVKPILGINAYIAEGSIDQKQPAPDNRTFHLILLAKDSVGYKNLIKLVTIGHLDGMFYKPRIDKKLLKKYSGGLIALSGDIQGEIPRYFWNEDLEGATRALNSYKEIFKDDFYLEILKHPNIERHDQIMDEIIKLGNSTNTPIVACHDSYYLNKDDKDAHRTLLAVQQNHINDDIRFLGSDEDFSFISPEEAKKTFKDIPQALKNTEIIADKCNVAISSPGWIFPKIETEKGLTHDEQLKEFVYRGLEDRKMKKTKEVEARIDYEARYNSPKRFCALFPSCC